MVQYLLRVACTRMMHSSLIMCPRGDKQAKNNWVGGYGSVLFSLIDLEKLMSRLTDLNTTDDCDGLRHRRKHARLVNKTILELLIGTKY